MKVLGKKILVKTELEKAEKLIVQQKNKGRVIAKGTKVDDRLAIGDLILFNEKECDTFKIKNMDLMLMDEDSVRLVFDGEGN